MAAAAANPPTKIDFKWNHTDTHTYTQNEFCDSTRRHIAKAYTECEFRNAAF